MFTSSALTNLRSHLPQSRRGRVLAAAAVAALLLAAGVLDGEQVIGFQVVRAWGASALVVADASRAAVERLGKQHPNVRFEEVSSTVDFIHESYAAKQDVAQPAQSVG